MGMFLRVLLVLLSAGLGIVVFPSVGWFGLAVVAWVPLILALQGVKTSHGFYLGLLHGALFYGVTLSWLVNIFKEMPYFVVPLVLILALFTGFFARGYALAHAHYGGGKSEWVVAFFAAVWWGAVEFFRCEIFVLKFPWMSPGVGLRPMWLSPWLGVYGIGFVLILGSALVCCRGRSPRLVGAVVLGVMLLSALFPKKTPAIDDPIKVMAVQSELTDGYQYVEMTQRAEQNVDLIVWPEYGIPTDIRKNQKQWLDLILLAKEKEAVMVVGTETVVADGWFNTALTLDADGELGDHYKNHTVHFFDDGTAGTEAKAINTPLGKVGTPICFDCDYEDVVRRMVADGAEFLAIPSMDAEHWTAREHHQHAELFRHRAAENARWMVVCATSGTTQILDPYGNRVVDIPLMKDGILYGEIGRRNERTFYTRFGWVFPWFLMGTGSIWVVALFVRVLLEARKSARMNRN
ncbi:hypothetical protein HW115_11000 [Verrucomicrobiaceae bacterium N1E253]|uniref:CN hydrolase domain-containing protein n=1 Tax=Oceaniferula marina TaxID=2748318 RepID=A0A851GG04_9BACT|nr:nitrilase-related carbon-nitrogen hydrolase [Oceaniferula marina]NWK56139.1 hypothetical protein [Oceaniferula marina]